MTNGKTLVVWTISMLALISGGCRAENKMTYTDLVGHLTDLERVSILPEQGEQCMQWSSYDRRSQYDVKTGKYIKWEANGDGDGSIRREGGKLVMAEMNGPGCIWRIWSATAKNGHVRIYLDGQPSPAVDLPFAGYFDGNHAPFNRSMLVHTAAGNGKNCYPILFKNPVKSSRTRVTVSTSSSLILSSRKTPSFLPLI
jgi:hypothetical protein